MAYSRWVLWFICMAETVFELVLAAGLIQQKETCRGFACTCQANQQEPLGPRTFAMANFGFLKGFFRQLIPPLQCKIQKTRGASLHVALHLILLVQQCLQIVTVQIPNLDANLPQRHPMHFIIEPGYLTSYRRPSCNLTRFHLGTYGEWMRMVHL